MNDNNKAKSELEIHPDENGWMDFNPMMDGFLTLGSVGIVAADLPRFTKSFSIEPP